MGQVSSSLSSLVGNDKSKENGNVITENKHKSNGQQFERKVTRSNDVEFQDTQIKSNCISKSFFSCVTPRLPIKRSRQISPESSVPHCIQDIFSPCKRLKMEDYLNFCFIEDYQSISFIKNSKIMFILRGLPGSGKSTVCRSLKKTYENAQICSADNYFLKDGVYDYDFTKIGDAHEQCHHHAIEAVQRQCNVVIVDNTFVKRWELKFYLQLAAEHNYIPLIVEPKTPWRRDLKTLVQNNTHGVTEEILALKGIGVKPWYELTAPADLLFSGQFKHQPHITSLTVRIKMFEELKPIYYGWFLNEKDSYYLNVEGQSWFKEAFEVKEFRNDFRSFTGCRTFEDMVGFYQMPRSRMMLHCTSKFIGSHEIQGGVMYPSKEILEDSIGKAFAIEVIGFFLTPRTFGARVKLTSKQKKLWAHDDEEEIPDDFSKVLPSFYNEEEDLNADNCSLNIESNGECDGSIIMEDDPNMNASIEGNLTETVEMDASITKNVNKLATETEIMSIACSEMLESDNHDQAQTSTPAANIIDTREISVLNETSQPCNVEGNIESVPINESSCPDLTVTEEISNSSSPVDSVMLNQSEVSNQTSSDSSPLKIEEGVSNVASSSSTSPSSMSPSSPIGQLFLSPSSEFSPSPLPPSPGSGPSLLSPSPESGPSTLPISPNSGPSKYSHLSGRKVSPLKGEKSPKKKQTEIPSYTFELQGSLTKETFSETYMDVSENRFQPTIGEGKRAHISLGTAPNEVPVTTGLDLLFINELEKLKVMSPAESDGSPQLPSKEASNCCKSIDLNGAVLKNYGFGVWVVYLENKLVGTSLFAMKS